MPLRRLLRIAAFVAIAAPLRLAAQGGNVDIIAGEVKDPAGKPIAGAIVEAISLETDVTRRQTTNAKGRYSIIFTDGGGRYRVTVRAIGYTPYIVNVSRQGDDDRIMLDLKLGTQAVTLADIVAGVARRPDLNGAERPTAGEAVRTLTGEQAMRLPIDASDLAALAALAPGVVLNAATDSTGATFLVAGQSAESNSYTLNGVTMDGSTVPQDAVRSTRVTTNSYDVARGGFAGGQVAVTTKGGSNRVSGSFSSRLQDRHLAFGGATDNAFTAGQTRQQVGFGFGGPLRRDHTFLFGSLQITRALAPMASLPLADAATLERLGVAPDSVARFMALVDATGLTARVGAVDPNRSSDQLQSVNRFDWNAGQAHIVTVTGQLGLNTQDPTRIGATQLPQVGGETRGHSGALAIQVASRFGALVNQFRLGGSLSHTGSTPFLLMPAGRVLTTSLLDDGRTATTTLGFGGNPGLPQTSDARQVELTNELSLMPGRGEHRFALGVVAAAQHFRQDVTTNRYGTYTWNSLADFAAGSPAQFVRTLRPTIRSGTAYTQAIYLSDAWRPRPDAGRGEGGGRAGVRLGGGGGGGGDGGGGRLGGGGLRAAAQQAAGGGGSNFQLVYGLRLEHTAFSGAPALNGAVLDAFGVRTDRLPSQTHLSPRVGFSVAIPGPEQEGQSQRGFAPPLLTIRGGAGLFRGAMPASLPGIAQAQSGLGTAQTQLFCVGAAVPLPDWSTWLADPAAIPDTCVGGGASPVLTGRPSVTTYAPDYAAPVTRRASLGLSRRITALVAFNVDASYVRGVGQSAARDLNLDTTPKFALTSEGGRPVFAAPGAIIPGTGAVPLAASRRDVRFGAVDQVFSALQNETKQVTLNLAGTTRNQIQLNLAYTLQSVRDMGGSGGRGLGGANPTDGDPNVYAWAPSMNERRHNIQASMSWPITPALELTTVAGITSGMRYTPMVAGDVNGDGARGNDRAFVFDPAVTADTAVAAAMTRLLAGTSGGARECLAAQTGRIAARNSCTGPWLPSLSLQVNWRPGLFDRRLAVSFQTINLLGGLDELFHGAEGLKGWGGNARPDNTLLSVRGFDPATQRFRYVVNERFGNTGAGATAVRQPFQLALNVRFALGFDQRTLQIQSLEQGRAVRPRASALVDSFLVRYHRQHAATAALARRDSLVLSDEQVAKLQAIADSSHRRMAPHLDSLTAEVERVQVAGSAADVGPLLQRLRPFIAQVQREQLAVRDAVRAVLDDVQWARLPEDVRNPSPNLLGGGPGDGGGRILRPGGGGGRPGGGGGA